jgi:hypothetical protein
MFVGKVWVTREEQNNVRDFKNRSKDSSKKLAWTNTVNYFQSSISDVGNSFMT